MSDESPRLEPLVDFIVRSIVSEPDAVDVSEGERRDAPVIRVQVAEHDRGAVIGRQGRTIRAIETVMRAGLHGRIPGLEVAD